MLADGELKLTLMAGVELVTEGGDVTAGFELTTGDQVAFVLHVDDVESPLDHQAENAKALFHDTVRYWRAWLDRSTYEGRWREMVHRTRADPEAADLRADGGDRRGADDIASGGPRRCA